MAEITDTVYVDGTFHANNIAIGRATTSDPAIDSNNNQSIAVTFPNGALAGTGDVVVVITGYGSTVSNRLVSSAIRNVTVTDVTATGFTARINRHSAINTTIFYMAFRS